MSMASGLWSPSSARKLRRERTIAAQGEALIFAHIFWGLGFSPRMGAFEP